MRQILAALTLWGLCLVSGQPGATVATSVAQAQQLGESPLPAAMPPQVQSDGPVELRLEASRNRFRVAEPIELRLSVEAPPGTRVTMPPVGSTLGPFEVLDTRRIESLPIAGQPERRRWTLWITIEAITSGQLEVPAMEVAYGLPEETAAGTRQGSLRTEPFPLEVTSLLSPEQDPKAFRDIKAVVEVPAEQTSGSQAAWLLAMLLAASLLGWGGWWWWRSDRRPPALERALQEIDRVETLRASDQITLLDAYVQLSDALRSWTEEALEIPATRMSSSELQQALADRSIPATARDPLTQFLTEADEVKFSGRPRTSVTGTALSVTGTALSVTGTALSATGTAPSERPLGQRAAAIVQQLHPFAAGEGRQS